MKTKVENYSKITGDLISEVEESVPGDICFFFPPIYDEDFEGNYPVKMVEKRQICFKTSELNNEQKMFVIHLLSKPEEEE